MKQSISEIIASSSAKAVGNPELVNLLSEDMPIGRVWSLLLTVLERRSKELSGSDILRRTRSQGVVSAAGIDQREFLELDRLMFGAIEQIFTAVELSPLCSFGLNAALSNTNQKKIFSAMRGTEVMSDLATALALEASLQRLDGRPDGHIRLCSSHRLARAQKYPENLGFTPHFRMFCLATADNLGFNVGDAMLEHIEQYLKFFAAANNGGWHISKLIVTLSDLAITEKIVGFHQMDRAEICARTLAAEGRLFDDAAPFAALMSDPSELATELREKYDIGTELDRLSRIGGTVRRACAPYPGGVSVRFALDRIGGLGHYEGLCFKIDGSNAAGQSFPLVDGGDTPWMRKLLSNNRERCLVSGIGTELFYRYYRAIA